MDGARSAGVGTAIGIVTWVATAFIFGYVGLSTVVVHPESLYGEFALQALAVGAVAALLGLFIGLAAARMWIMWVLIGVVVVDMIGAAILAPLAISELPFFVSWQTLLVLLAGGAQPAGAAVGLAIGRRLRS